MKLYSPALLVILSCASLHATVTITSLTPSVPSPQPLGTEVTFTVTATDTGAGPLAFKFSNSYQSGTFSVIRNFNIGTLSAGVWTAQPFVWDSIDDQGSNLIQVVAQDFKTGETATMTIPFTLNSIISAGKLTVLSTSHPLVALAAIPSCPAGSFSRASFTRNAGGVTSYTSFLPCHAGSRANNVYIGGLYPGANYTIGYQILTGTTITPGASKATFTSGPLPSTFTYPAQVVVESPTAQADIAEKEVLHSYINLGPSKYQPTGTDLEGNVNWFYNPATDNQVLLTRPEPGGYFVVFQSGIAWSNGKTIGDQLLREIDLTGNVLKETNIGLLQQQLLAVGATDMQSCANITLPAAVGSSCLISLSHDAITMPNGGYAFIGIMEKIFPPGTQGNTTGLNVDILGDAIIVVDANLNASWYFDSFQHDGGGNQLNINRPAILGETCGIAQGGCPTGFLEGTPGVTAVANDWLHSNSLQYRSSDENFILSIRHQDWVVKVDYKNGTGTGNILWRLGHDGDFTFNNINNDAYPWFSHQHDVGFEPTGVLSIFDNGNTRISTLGPGNSRGMVLNVDESALTATPVLSQDLGYYAMALGSAQLLSNGNYHFQPGFVPPNSYSFSVEFFPTPGTTIGTEVFNLESEATSYRSFRMPSLYLPPTT